MSLQRFERKVATLGLDAAVVTAAQLMRDERVGCVVVTREGRPIGILTDRDLTIRVLAARREPAQTRVSDVVTYDVATLLQSDTIETAFHSMREHGVRRLPIIDPEGKLIGIVTADDLVPLLAHELLDLGAGIEENVDTSESR